MPYTITSPKASMAYRLPRLSVLVMNSRLIKAALLSLDRASDAHIDALDVCPAAQLLDSTLAFDQAGIHQIGPVDDLQAAVHVLLDQQDGHAALVQAGDQLENLVDQGGGQPQRGLVQHEQARTGHERAGDGQLLLLAAREGGPRLLQALLEYREEVVDLIEVAPVLGSFAAGESTQAQVFLHGQAGENVAALRRPGGGPAGGGRGGAGGGGEN